MILRAVAVLVVVGVGSGLAAIALGQTLRLFVKHRPEGYWHGVRAHCQRPFTAASTAAGMYFAAPETRLPPPQLETLHNLLLIIFIITLAWFTTRNVHFLEEFLFHRYLAGSQDPKTRRGRTQLDILRRLTSVLIVLGAIGAILAVFEPVRRLGISLLASAGIASLLLGIAAQPALAGTVAGIQLAFADSLRLDDVVVVEDEWGRIERLNLTDVVLRMWDGRRLILPCSYFTSKPYQNWTRYETKVLGTVELPLDYTADIDVLRREAHHIIEGIPLWDRQDWLVQVIDVMDQGQAKVQISASAADGPSAWNLRCEIRERVLRYLRDEHPEWMPRRASYQP